MTDINDKTIRKYVSWLKREKYVHIRDGNLCLRSTLKIVEQIEKLVRIDSLPWTTWRQFENRVYAQLIKRNIKQQAYHYHMKGVVAGKQKKVNISVKAYRQYRTRYNDGAIEETAMLPPCVSVRQLARLFGKSQGWAQQRLKLLEKMGYIKIKQHVVRTDHYGKPKWLSVYAYVNKRSKCMIIHYGSIVYVKH